MLAPGDTLLKAMRVMERAREGLLPVVCAGGILVGIVSDLRLREAWRAGPLESVGKVMSPVDPWGNRPFLLPTG